VRSGKEVEDSVGISRLLISNKEPSNRGGGSAKSQTLLVVDIQAAVTNLKFDYECVLAT